MYLIVPDERLLEKMFVCTTSKIYFKNKLLTRGPSFSKTLRQAAINFCEKYFDPKLFCLIVEGNSYFTVWIDKSEIESKVDQYQRIIKIEEGRRQEAEDRSKLSGRYSTSADQKPLNLYPVAVFKPKVEKAKRFTSYPPTQASTFHLKEDRNEESLPDILQSASTTSDRPVISPQILKQQRQVGVRC